MLKALSTILFVFAGFVSFAQSPDTLTLMHYNLLNYRNTTGQCTESTNNADDKDGYLATIVAHAKPDVLTVNEMGANWLNPNKILTNALNVDGVNHFDQAEFSNNGFSSLTNMLFYNKDKLVYYKQDVIAKDIIGDELVRVIDIYTLYYNDSRALNFGDTTFLSFVVAHLKAGSASDDKAQRALMTQAVMAYLDENKLNHAYFMCGDFNVQTSSEPSYKNLVEHSDVSVRFYDPIDASGSWNNNSNFANVHTQSTHVSDTRGGCFSSGGMDDRFDFILCGKEVLDQTYRVGYIDQSYHALGQDSRRFNGDIITPLNSLIPNNVALALYDMSDHLPVILQVEVQKKSLSINNIPSNESLIVKYKSDGRIVFQLSDFDISSFKVYDVNGVEVQGFEKNVKPSQIEMQIQTVQSGVYIAYIKTSAGATVRKKFVIIN